MRVDADGEEIKLVLTEMETENIEEMKTEITKEVGTENSKDVEIWVEKKGNVEAILTTFEAEKPEVGPEVEVLKSTIKKHCFIWDISLNNLTEEYERETGFVLIEKVSLIQADPQNSTCGCAESVDHCSQPALQEEYEGCGRTY